MGHSIEARLSVQSLVFRPSGEPVSFGIEVLNQSDRFVAFEVSLSAAGSNPSARWYRLSPEVSAAKPPGDRTDFRVEILDSPIPNFVGTVNLTIRIFSPQLSEERRLVLRLTIEPGSGAVPLKVDVLGHRFQVYPRNLVNLTTRVQNLGSRVTEVLLRLTELDPAWIVGSAERRLEIGAGQSAEVSFQCQPPSAQQVPSQDYPFTIAATTRDGASATGNGIVEVLPIGFVQFEAKPQEQKLPPQGGWLPEWRSRIALFELLLKNTSNLRQQASIELRGDDCQRCNVQLNETPTPLPIGQATPILLKVKPKRPWIGRVKLLQFEAKAWLSDSRLGSPDPATQRLLLRVFPIIPLWLLLALLAGIASLIMVLLQPPAVTHLASVNTVLFSGTSGLVPLVLSGSDDCTIRSWTVQETTLQPRGTLAQGDPSEACSDRKPASRSGLLAMTGKPVRTLALIPANNQLLFAGLQSGEIQVWDVNRGRLNYTLKDPSDRAGDLFSLAFTRDSHYLYSGYGSGLVQVWESTSNGQFNPAPTTLRLNDPVLAQIHTLALSQDGALLVTGGQFKRLVVWDLSRSATSPTPRIIQNIPQSRGTNDFFWNVTFMPNQPILATADSDGYITLWDLSQCQGGLDVQCQIRDRWQASTSAIRSVQVTSDDRQLISAGDDGRIVAWSLTSDHKRDQTQKERIIATLPRRIVSLNLTQNDQLIVSGGEDSQVRLHSLN